MHKRVSGRTSLSNLDLGISRWTEFVKIELQYSSDEQDHKSESTIFSMDLEMCLVEGSRLILQESAPIRIWLLSSSGHWSIQKSIAKFWKRFRWEQQWTGGEYFRKVRISQRLRKRWRCWWEVESRIGRKLTFEGYECSKG